MTIGAIWNGNFFRYRYLLYSQEGTIVVWTAFLLGDALNFCNSHTNTKKQQPRHIKSLLMSQIHSPLGSFASRIAANIYPSNYFFEIIESDEQCQW